MAKRALIVDDSRATRAMLKRLLAPLGYESVEAGNGNEGLERLEEAEVDLALVDWNMPELDGLGFIRAVRSESRYERIRLVMVTSENDPARIARALMAGADEYAMKPITSEGLAEKLQLVGLDAEP